MITRKTANAMGPAMGLGALQKEKKPPRLDHERKRRHVFVVSRFNRRCSRCGLEEEKSITGELGSRLAPTQTEFMKTKHPQTINPHV